MGERKVCVIANSYIYYGTYRGSTDGFINLNDAYIIYDTGPWKDKEWKTAEYLGKECGINIAHVESWIDTDKALPGQATYPAGQGKICNPAVTEPAIGIGQAGDGTDRFLRIMMDYRYADELQAHDAYLKVRDFVYGQPSRTPGETGAGKIAEGSRKPRGIGEGDVGVE